MLLSLLAASGLFLTLFLVLHWNPIVSFLLSAGVYFGLFLLLKPSRKIAGLRLDGLKDGELRRIWKRWSAPNRRSPKRPSQTRSGFSPPQPGA